MGGMLTTIFGKYSLLQIVKGRAKFNPRSVESILILSSLLDTSIFKVSTYLMVEESFSN